MDRSAHACTHVISHVTACIHVWWGEGETGSGAAGWWEGLDSTSRTACSAVYMNELASQVCTGEPVRNVRVGATPEVTSWFVSHSPNDLFFFHIYTEKCTATCPTHTNIHTPSYQSHLDKQIMKRVNFLSQLVHWVKGYVRSELYYAICSTLSIQSVLLRPWMNELLNMRWVYCIICYRHSSVVLVTA